MAVSRFLHLKPTPPPPEGGQPTPPEGGQPTPSPPEGEQPAPPPPEKGKLNPFEAGQPYPPECRIPPQDKLAAEELSRDINNNNFNESITIAKICEQPSKTWFGNCTDTQKCDKQCIEWEDARHGACRQRETKFMCFCYFSCGPNDWRPPVPPDCPRLPPKYVEGRLSS
ncbi:Gamma thionin [Cynara cardunculus var. scolymus]|uniref:Gamma thionin n=1 Tax=Cynara cardunculus var. scolymus TaxID=59895 RepID=A0A103YK91_CYNCS|nr:Gamma thionin [Cynara cardunculus var. scolymus]